MRWDDLATDDTHAAQARLPGYRDPATVRRFDAPEALDIRFYEVAAKSVLNRVPEASRMPFRFTVNPYRGCTHACVYCLAGDTPVLMADGSHRPIADLRAGDAVHGTHQVGAYRRYVHTSVVDHWETGDRAAWRVTLHDGTELVASADHRFLTRRGWRFVAGAARGDARRPHLAVNDFLAGSGRFAAQPAAGADYRRGYVCGLLRGDARYAAALQRRELRLVAPRPAAGGSIDEVALERARSYLVHAGGHRRDAAFARTGAPVRRPGGGTAVAVADAGVAGGPRRGNRPDFAWISLLTRWPACASDDWRRGFLAGLYDAIGSRSAFALSFTSDAREVAEHARDCLDRLGFDAALELAFDPAGAARLRLRGGLAEQLRFLHLTDPAIARKRDISGQSVKSPGELRVVAVEPLDTRVAMYDITTGTGDFIADGVISHNCFARPTHTYLDFNAGRDFEREIVVKVNAPEALRAELARPSWSHEHVALGTNTDPYQWVESRYRLMPGIWEALRDSRTPCSVLTKSPLLLRDLDLMLDVARHTHIQAALSIPTLEEKAWRATEPHTPHPRARLEAVAELTRAGIPTGVLVAPLMPGITTRPSSSSRCCARSPTQARPACRGSVCTAQDVKRLFMEWLAEHRPDLVEHYRKLYGSGAYAPAAERRRLSDLVADARRDHMPRAVRRCSAASCVTVGRARRSRPHANARRRRSRSLRTPVASSPRRVGQPGTTRSFAMRRQRVRDTRDVLPLRGDWPVVDAVARERCAGAVRVPVQRRLHGVSHPFGPSPLVVRWLLRSRPTSTPTASSPGGHGDTSGCRARRRHVANSPRLGSYFVPRGINPRDAPTSTCSWWRLTMAGAAGHEGAIAKGSDPRRCCGGSDRCGDCLWDPEREHWRPPIRALEHADGGCPRAVPRFT